METVNEILDCFKNAHFTTLRYEDLSSWEVGKAVIKEAVNHWEPLGFLDGIDDEVKKEQISVAFDNMANDLIFENERVSNISKKYDFNFRPDDENERGPEFAVFVFPMIRRIICKVDNFNYDKFLTALEKLSFIAINYDEYYFEWDIEAEICAILSGAIEEMFKNENI